MSIARSPRPASSLTEPGGRRPVVLITGAARRVGRAIALELARSGADIALHYRASAVDAEDTAAALRALGATVALLPADLSDEVACRALLPRAVAALGAVDAVVNNAALFDYDDVASFSVAAMERHWRANTAPALILAQALHEHVLARDGRDGRGCVVNLLDQKLANPNPDYLSYTLSKAALAAAGTMLAQALAPQLRVVGVSPGVTMISGQMSEAEFAAAHHLTPLGRSSTPEDIARAVRFAIESPALTGSTLLIDGGQHLMAQPRDVAFLVQG